MNKSQKEVISEKTVQRLIKVKDKEKKVIAVFRGKGFLT